MAERTPEQKRTPKQKRQLSPEDQKPSFGEVMRAFGPALEGETFRRLMATGIVIELPGFTIASEATIEGIQKEEVLPPANKE